MAETIRKLGRFELLRRIAKGGMGEIYLARQRGTAGFEKNVIIKTILPHLAEEQEFVEKFLDEGHIVVQLIHGNIVPVFDMDETDGEYYIAMEYIPGRDLREIQKRLDVKSDRMPSELALHITQEVCKGLDYAHRKTDNNREPLDIVHRDVSPSNILVSREGEVKIIDFGIARATSRIGKTVSGRIQGKFAYMSPEQASGGRLDGRSDLFSAGVVLYELLTGFRPFEGESDLHTLDLVRKCDFEPPSTLIPSIPTEIDDIVAKALAKNPDDRYESADQFQVAILQHLYSDGSGPTSNELAGFLGKLFPEGFERDDLRAARDSSPPKKMSLDDAMDLELGRLAPEIDPLNTTAISASDAQLSNTPTLATVPEPKPQESESAVIDTRDSSHQAVGTKRGIGVGLGVGLLIALLFGVYIASASTKNGSVVIESDPANAEIEIDGATIPGARTPYKTELPLGTHEVTLSTQGHASRTFQIEVSKDAVVTLSKKDALLPKLGPPASKKIRVEAKPSDARLSADGMEFGTGNGVLTIKPKEEIVVEASRAGCTPRRVHLKHSFASETLQISLNCDEVKETPDPKRVVKEPTKTGSKKITFKTNPSGAIVSVNGKKLGASPITRSFKSSESIQVSASLTGYAPISISKRVADIRGVLNLKLSEAEMGCLNLRLGFPAVGRVAIDGQWLAGEIGRLKNHPLSAGSHKVRVKNDAVGKDDTLSIEIKPGSACTLKVIWPRQ